MDNILIEVHHGIGDVIHMIPTLQALNDSKKFLNIDVIVGGEAQKDILKTLGFIRNIYILNTKKINLKQYINLINILRKNKYTIGITSPISNTLMGSLLLVSIGCKIRVGETKDRKIHFFNCPIIGQNIIHRVERNEKLLKNIKVEISKKIYPYIEISGNTNIEESIYKKRVGVCMGTGKFVNKKLFKKEYFNAKFWGKEKNIKLINLLQSAGYEVIMIGGKEEEEDNKMLIKELEQKGILNYVNKGTILETAAVLKSCKLVFGCDTGPIHLAAAVGTDTLTIFGPTDPMLIGAYATNAHYYSLGLACQYCYGTSRMRTCSGRECIQNVSAEEIFEKIQQIIG